MKLAMDIYLLPSTVKIIVLFHQHDNDHHHYNMVSLIIDVIIFFKKHGWRINYVRKYVPYNAIFDLCKNDTKIFLILLYTSINTYVFNKSD